MQCTKKLKGIVRASKCLSNTKPAVILTSPDLSQWIKSLIRLGFFLTIYLTTCCVLTLATIWEWSSKTSECTGWRNDYYFNISFSRWRMNFFPLEFISSCFVDLIHLLPYESTHIFLKWLLFKQPLAHSYFAKSETLCSRCWFSCPCLTCGVCLLVSINYL